jgi:hypothetical protein
LRLTRDLIGGLPGGELVGGGKRAQLKQHILGYLQIVFHLQSNGYILRLDQVVGAARDTVQMVSNDRIHFSLRLGIELADLQNAGGRQANRGGGDAQDTRDLQPGADGDPVGKSKHRHACGFH